MIIALSGNMTIGDAIHSRTENDQRVPTASRRRAMTLAFKVSSNAEKPLEVGEAVEFEMTPRGEDFMITKIERLSDFWVLTFR